MDARFNPPIVIDFADGQELDLETELPGKLDIESRNLADPFGEDLFKGDAGAETEAEEQMPVYGRYRPLRYRRSGPPRRSRVPAHP